MGRVSGFADQGYIVRVRSDYDTLEARANDTSRVCQQPTCNVTLAAFGCSRRRSVQHCLMAAFQVQAECHETNLTCFSIIFTGEGAGGSWSAFHLNRLPQPTHLLQQQLPGRRLLVTADNDTFADLQHFSIMGTRFRECFSESVRPPQVRLPTAMVCNPLTTGTGLGDTGSTLGTVDSSSGVPSDATPQCSPAGR